MSMAGNAPVAGRQQGTHTLDTSPVVIDEIELKKWRRGTWLIFMRLEFQRLAVATERSRARTGSWRSIWHCQRASEGPAGLPIRSSYLRPAMRPVSRTQF